MKQKNMIPPSEMKERHIAKVTNLLEKNSPEKVSQVPAS